jgi:hypothetical protein
MSKRRRKGSGSVLAVQAAWFGLGMKLLETGAHAADVIARRGTMLAAATLEPAKLADPEFVRMAAEKAEATGEACLRAARHAAAPDVRPTRWRSPPRESPWPRRASCPTTAARAPTPAASAASADRPAPDRSKQRHPIARRLALAVSAVARGVSGR